MKDQMEPCNLALNSNNRIMIYHDITEDHDNSHPSCPKTNDKTLNLSMLPSELHMKTKACT